MNVNCKWTPKSRFTADMGPFQFSMDAVKPFGEEAAPTPKQLVLAALCGCTGMDVIGLLKKHKQVAKEFKIDADASVKTEHPHSFDEIHLKYLLKGNCEPTKVIEAIDLSQTKYCAVSAMLSCSVIIKYEIWLNGELIKNGKTDFGLRNKGVSYA